MGLRSRNPQENSALVRTMRLLVLPNPRRRTREVPFANTRTAAYFMHGLAEIFDLMEAGRWHAAEAPVASLLCTGEQAALKD